jgi:ATP-dependent Lon protease
MSNPDVQAPPVAAAPIIKDEFYKPPKVLEEVLQYLSADDSAKHLVYLHGAPGIGKTSMAEAVHARCAEVRFIQKTLAYHACTCGCERKAWHCFVALL